MMHRVAIYARVSTPEQSPEMQLRDLRELAERRGFEVVREYIDAGISGAASPQILDHNAENRRRTRKEAKCDDPLGVLLDFYFYIISRDANGEALDAPIRRPG